MHFAPIRLAACALTAFAWTHALAADITPTTLDVAGIRMGMTEAQVNSVLRAANAQGSNLDTETSYLDEQQLPGARLPRTMSGCLRGKAMDCSDVVTVQFGRLSRQVLYIHRHFGDKADAPVGQKTVVDSVVGKFGRPFLQVTDRPEKFEGTWFFSTSGDRMKAPDPLCGAVENSQPSGAPFNSRVGCGLAMRVMITSIMNSPAFGYFSLHATDHGALVKDFLGLQAARDAAKKADANKVNAAPAPRM
jgi:hypothetical protein